MSSTQSHIPVSQQASSLTNNKKKFGKNLNKLIKQPAPPITGIGGVGLSSRSLNSARSGLLLLSTKKSSSGLLGTKLSVTSKNFGTVSLKSEASVPKSKHDELLNAAAAEAAGIVEPKQKEALLPAWGVGEKITQSSISSVSVPVLAPKGGKSDVRNTLEQEKSANTSKTRYPIINDDMILRKPADFTVGEKGYGAGSLVSQPRTMIEEKDISHSPDKIQNMSIQEKNEKIENGINQTVTNPPNASVDRSDVLKSLNNREENSQKEGQVEFMARLARQRAEKRRMEEEARVNDQKERAARRLKELESKIKSVPPSPDDTSPITSHAPTLDDSETVTTDRGRWRQNNSSHNKSEIVLERLGKTKKGYGSKAITKANESHNSKASLRTLYNPNRSYSSLVGGSKGMRSTSDVSVEDVKEDDMDKFVPTPVSPTGREVNNPVQHCQNDLTLSPVTPVFQLASYEDRDRGGRNSSAGPRMLFDPKSGSMVKAPARDDCITSGKGRKERSKSKSRNGKDKGEVDQALSKCCDTTSSQISARRSPSDEIAIFDNHMEGKFSKQRSHRREEQVSFRKERKKSEKVIESQMSPRNDSTTWFGNRRGGNRSEHETTNRQKEKISKIPRTCGVLYKRDNKGNLYSADTCDGDHGYGAHSVPGGRVKNKKAYSLYIKNEGKGLIDALQQNGNSVGYFESHSPLQFSSSAGTHAGHHLYKSDYELDGEKNSISLSRTNFMKPSTLSKEESSTVKTDFDVPSPLMVKPNERIELLTGVDESPTLQATAVAWAPSEAALAAAQAAALTVPLSDVESYESDGINESEVPVINAMALIENDDDLEENKSPSILGLGFDPTENMDSVMMSPADEVGSTEDLGTINLTALTLNQATNTKSAIGTTSNPFGSLGATSSFLGSSTWGTGISNSISMGSLSNWDYLGNGKEISNASSTRVTENSKPVAAKSFLSLASIGSESTWGSGGFVGGLTNLNGSNISSHTQNTAGDAD